MAHFNHKGKKINYKLHLLVCDGNPIDQKVALENLKIFDAFMKKHGLSYSLAYGTCLGAVRDHGFIPHDEDCDIAVKKDVYDAILDNYQELKNSGLQIVRHDLRDQFSLWRDNEYIDIIAFKDYDKDAYIGCNMYQMPRDFLDNLKYVEFKDTQLPVPKHAEEYMLFEYGETWGTPIKYEEKVGIVWVSKLRALLKYMIPDNIKAKLFERTGQEYREQYAEKMLRYKEREQNIESINN